MTVYKMYTINYEYTEMTRKSGRTAFSGPAFFKGRGNLDN